MEMIYHIKDRPPFSKMLVFAFQQVLAILAGTITLPLIVGHGLSQSAALFGAAVGTIVYLLITKFRSPVFLGSSFTFLGSMSSAFAGAATAAIGYVGVIIGAILAGLVYVILGVIVKFTGTKWIKKLMPPVIIGPVVALIGLTLAPGAITNLLKGSVYIEDKMVASPYICLLCGLFALAVTIICSVYGKKMIKLAPFIIGISAGYLLALIFTLIGNAAHVDALKIIDFAPFHNLKWLPDFAFTHVVQGFKDFEKISDFWRYFGFIAVLYVPIAIAVFAEHIADHENLSSIIEKDLIKDPGLHRTLIGDGCGSMVGAIFGACPNTTYGESISCVAFSKNCSIITIITACAICIIASFIGPLMALFSTIPPCIIGGLSIALYGYIAASGFSMLKKVDMKEVKNIFVISTILVVGIGGLTISFNHFEFSPIACAFVVGVLVNLLVNIKRKEKDRPSNVEESIEQPQSEAEK